ncbi:MAG: hypothetical protein EOP67_38140 [Sphingomonas sp.]|nr:MAG: hypothetical protein EOP67_38140 [Sphingomonas sp.]
MRILPVIAIAIAMTACAPSSDETAGTITPSETSPPDPLVAPVTMDDVRWLEDLWLGCHAVMPEYDAAWADRRLDEDDLRTVAAAVAREHEHDPEGRTCRYTRAVPPVLERGRLQRLLGMIGMRG